MNKHGRHAMEMVQKHDPATFRRILRPEEYFSTLGEQIQDQIWQRTQALLPHRTKGQDPMEFIALSKMARAQARELVYQEMIYAALPPTPQ